MPDESVGHVSISVAGRELGRFLEANIRVEEATARGENVAEFTFDETLDVVNNRNYQIVSMPFVAGLQADIGNASSGAALRAERAASERLRSRADRELEWNRTFCPTPRASASELNLTERHVYGVGIITRVSALSIIGPYLCGTVKATALYETLEPILRQGRRVVLSLDEVEFNQDGLEYFFALLRTGPEPVNRVLADRKLDISLRTPPGKTSGFLRMENTRLIRRAIIASDSLTRCPGGVPRREVLNERWGAKLKLEREVRIRRPDYRRSFSTLGLPSHMGALGRSFPAFAEYFSHACFDVGFNSMASAAMHVRESFEQFDQLQAQLERLKELGITECTELISFSSPDLFWREATPCRTRSSLPDLSGPPQPEDALWRQAVF